MSSRLTKISQQTGDTIVEVLVAMAIIGATLGVAFNIASRSQASIRGAEERSQALKLAEQQVERLKQYIADNGATAFSAFPTNTGFCFYEPTPGPSTLQIRSGVANPTDPDCAVDQDGNFDIDDGSLVSSTQRDIQYPYEAGMTYDSANDEFHVFAGRFTLSNNTVINTKGFQVVNLQYRIHP